MVLTLSVGGVVEGPDIGEVGNEFRDTDDDLYLVHEGLECFWNIWKLFTEVREFFKVALDTVVISGHFLVELKVFLLQWGNFIFWHPSWGCSHGIGFSWGLGQAQRFLFMGRSVGSESVIYVCEWSWVILCMWCCDEYCILPSPTQSL
jgi:hypothetical protein